MPTTLRWFPTFLILLKWSTTESSTSGCTTTFSRPFSGWGGAGVVKAPWAGSTAVAISDLGEEKDPNLPTSLALILTNTGKIFCLLAAPDSVVVFSMTGQNYVHFGTRQNYLATSL